MLRQGPTLAVSRRLAHIQVRSSVPALLDAWGILDHSANASRRGCGQDSTQLPALGPLQSAGARLGLVHARL